MAETWLDIARDARKAASVLVREERHRSAVGRAYYAAFSKVTHELVATAGLPVPPQRGHFGHARTRAVVETSMPNMTRQKRERLSQILGRLATLRVHADYIPSAPVEGREAREAVSIMNTTFDSF